MTTQIQRYFSHFSNLFGKLIAFALFLFILTSFNLQIISATAQTPDPTKPKPDTTQPTTNTGSTTGSKILTQKQLDDRIGTLKKCTVNSSNETALKNDPTAANKFIVECLKDIIQIVITISVILAIMRLVFVGIKFLNTFEDEGKLQGELAKAITGFVAGAVILGLFAAIINVVNPSALRIDQIFSAQVIADYKSLDKGLGAGGTKQGSGTGASNQVFTSESIKTVLESTKSEDKAKQDEIKANISKCDSFGNLTFATEQEALNCKIFQQYTSDNPSLTTTLTLDAKLEPNMSGNRYANGSYSNIIVNGKIITTDFTKTGSKKTKKIVFEYFEGCEKSPLLSEKTITSGQKINVEGCNMDISSNK